MTSTSQPEVLFERWGIWMPYTSIKKTFGTVSVSVGCKMCVTWYYFEHNLFLFLPTLTPLAQYHPRWKSWILTVILLYRYTHLSHSIHVRSMYCIFTYIYPQQLPSFVGKYAVRPMDGMGFSARQSRSMKWLHHVTLGDQMVTARWVKLPSYQWSYNPISRVKSPQFFFPIYFRPLNYRLYTSYITGGAHLVGVF